MGDRPRSVHDEWAEVRKKDLEQITGKKPWFQINHVRTKIIEQQLTRIANALDAILEEQYDRYMTPPKADTSGREPEVMYTDQDKYDIDELVEELREDENER